MKVNKLSKSKINKNKTKRNNKTKNKTKTKKRINHLKGGNNENKTRLLNFINSLPTNENDIKILTYFDIKIILLYIVAYELVNRSIMRQIFLWLNNNNSNKSNKSNNSNNSNKSNKSTTSPLNIMMLFNSSLDNLSPINKGNKLLDDPNLYNGIILLNEIYKIINRVIDFTTITKQMLFTFKYIISKIKYNEYTEFFNYLSKLNCIKSPENLTKNYNTRIRNRYTNIVQISDDSPKVIQLKYLLGETNYIHFISNYPKIFEDEGNMVNFNQFQKLNATTPQSKINSPNITKCSNYITKTPLEVKTTTPIYDCFLKNCKLLINYVDTVDTVDNINGVFGTVSGGITLKPFINTSSYEMAAAEEAITSSQ